MEYTQANKKKDMAAKMPMGLKMNGKTTGYGGGMKYRGQGKDSGKGGGMCYPETGKGGKGKLAEKPIMSEKHPGVGKSIYTQNAK